MIPTIIPNHEPICLYSSFFVPISTNPTIAPARARGNDRIIGNGRMNATPAKIQDMTLRVESFFFSPFPHPVLAVGK